MEPQSSHTWRMASIRQLPAGRAFHGSSWRCASPTARWDRQVVRELAMRSVGLAAEQGERQSLKGCVGGQRQSRGDCGWQCEATSRGLPRSLGRPVLCLLFSYGDLLPWKQPLCSPMNISPQWFPWRKERAQEDRFLQGDTLTQLADAVNRPLGTVARRVTNQAASIGCM